MDETTGTPETEKELRRQIGALQEALTALAAGGVDAVVVGAQGSEQVHALRNADRPYRVIVESMGEGSATLSERGVLLFANAQLGALLGVERDALLGRDFVDFVASSHRQAVIEMLEKPSSDGRRIEAMLSGGAGTVPVLLSSTLLEMDGVTVQCLVVTDLTAQKALEERVSAEAVLAEQRAERQRMAFEVNDTIVQGLAAAEIAFDTGQLDRSRALLGRTARAARDWISTFVEVPRLEPGMAVRMDHARPGGASETLSPD